jgi:CO/xanthine dehydrogenase FAD-binding subunit
MNFAAMQDMENGSIRYAKPHSLEEALTLLTEGPWRLLAGGTDFYPALGAKPLRENVLDVNALSELRGISDDDAHIVIGARTTWTAIAHADLPLAFDALKAAARAVGSVQIQNVGTVAGNLCNASPAADGVPALMVLDAEIELRSAGAMRRLPLEKFILGNRKTAIAPGEMVTAIRIPKDSARGGSAFVKLGARRYLVISIAMAAARLAIGADRRIEQAAIAVGSCSAVAQRLPALEAALVGRQADASLGWVVAAEHLASLTPIDDVRGSREYRVEAAREIVGRALLVAAGVPEVELAA